MRSCRSPFSWCLMFCLGLASWSPKAVVASDEPSVSGTLTANGKTIELPYVYVYALEKGFYDEADPAWKILFIEHPIEERELQVYSQNIKFAADSGGNVSGGTYPEIELTNTGPDFFAGRVYHPEEQKIFDDTFQYDFMFSAPLSDPDAPIGDPLPADGGEPGKAYLAWAAALHAGDVEALKALVPAEMVGQFDSDEVKADLEMMQAMTPTGLTVLGGSSDGKTAILQVEGVMEGEKVRGEITLESSAAGTIATVSLPATSRVEPDA
jgi:hypothetical protein